MRLLFVEDETSLRTLTAKRLKEKGFSVDECDNGMDALDYISFTEYDGIILDIMLPRLDGISVLKDMRLKKKTTPVLLLTARGAVPDRVEGLNSGADDYLVKPFAFDELLARLHAMIRRQSAQVPSNLLILGDLTMDLSAHTATRGGMPLNLSQKEFALLEYLLYNQGIVLTRDKIEQHIWSYEYEGASNIIDVYIRSLRKKIDDPFPAKLLHTVRGVGYVARLEQ